MSALTQIVLTAVAIALVVGLVVAFTPRVIGRLRARFRKVPHAEVRETEGLRFATTATAAVLATVAGGLSAGYGVGFLGAGTPACPGVTDPTIPAQAAAAFTCGETQLDFSAASHGNYDVQFLDIEVNGRAVAGGPIAAIYPERRAHRNNRSSLGEGRIVAKIWVDPSATDGYPKLGLGPGINYIWIDAINPPQGNIRRVNTDQFPGDTIPGFGIIPNTAAGERGERGEFRAVVIPSGGRPVTILPVDVFWHHEMDEFAAHNHALARWIFWPDDIGGWVGCMDHGCCSMGN